MEIGIGHARRQALDDRQHPAQLLGFADCRRARPRRLAADVDDVGAVGRHTDAGLDGASGSRWSAAVGELNQG